MMSKMDVIMTLMLDLYVYLPAKVSFDKVHPV